MYMPALTAIRCDPYVKGFYETLVGRGKRKMQAVCAVMRQYLTGLWACMLSGESFDTAKLFSETPAKSLAGNRVSTAFKKC
jgi:transposase